MVGTANGRADLVGSPIELGDFLPEKRQVKLNGRTYEAWVSTNRAYPRRLQAQLDRYKRRYDKVLEPLTVADDASPDDKPTPEEIEAAVDRAEEAHQQFVTDAVMVLVINLSEDEAELIPLERAEWLLRELGYFKPLDELSEDSTSEVSQSDADPLTGDTSQAASPGSTDIASTSN